MHLMWRLLLSGASLALAVSCTTIPSRSLPAGASISVDHPEIFDNAQLQSQLDRLRGQLATLGIVDTSTLTGALGTVQGTSISQRNFSLQVLGRATPSVTTVVPSITDAVAKDKSDTATTTRAALTPAVPAAAAAPAPGALPTVTSDAIGLIDKQMQLETQLQGYQLLLGGSDFARYTIAGQVKDRVVIGFPITITPQDQHKNMAAEVEITYFPPNSNQFRNPRECQPTAFTMPSGATETLYSKGDENNATKACLEQEATPTIINILPAERSFNTIGVASSATQFGAAAIVGTVSLGASGGSSQQTEYLVAQQDTVALQSDGVARCVSTAETDKNGQPIFKGEPPSDEVFTGDTKDASEHCVAGSRGIRFKWQFRPVLGEEFVRPGRRVTFVQLAIPNVRRPYPNYGGIVYIKRAWKPVDTKTGVVKEAPVGSPGSKALPDPGPSLMVKYVLGHTFIPSEVSSIITSDLGSGSLLVSLNGTYLTGATVRIGGTILNAGTPGFIADYNSLQFVTTASALAQSGAVLISSEGVESPINLASVCKSWDEQSECALHPPGENPQKIRIVGVSVFPVSDTTSLIRIKIDKPSLKFERYTYYHYKRTDGDVQESLDSRIVNTSDAHHVERQGDLQARLDSSLNRWPIVLNVGGKTYGFSDLPFQSTGIDDGHLYFSVVATNDSINASPQVKIQRLFGNPEDDSDWQPFVPPGRLNVAIDPQWVAANGAKKDPKGPCQRGVTCYYVLSGAGVDNMEADLTQNRSGACRGKATLDPESFIQNTARRVSAPACARQVFLRYPSNPKTPAFTGEIVLTLSGPNSTVPVTDTDAIPSPGAVAPHFQMVRSVSEVSESSGSASITVGIQNLKDQSATVGVQYADIVTAKDGSGNSLAVQPGNKVMVTQDTSITFQVRNYPPKGVKVEAEGKNGTVSAGKLSFSSNFLVKPGSGGGGTNKTP